MPPSAEHEPPESRTSPSWPAASRANKSAAFIAGVKCAGQTRMRTMENAWLALVLFVGVLGAGCGNGNGDVTDVCACNSCSHPYGACPGETLPNSCPGESDGSQPCPCPNPGATAGVSGVTYVCQDGAWTAEADAAPQENSD
jgi:hypothetical protein